MIKKSANTVGVYLQESSQAKPALESQIAIAGSGYGSTVMGNQISANRQLPTDLITDYLAKHDQVSPDALVTALGLQISQVLSALAELERFGFVQLTRTEGKTVVSRTTEAK